jgi:hypothetical protein
MTITKERFFTPELRNKIKELSADPRQPCIPTPYFCYQ